MSAFTDWLKSAIGIKLTSRGITLRQATAYNVLVGMGYTEEGACAIVGNLCQESGSNLNSIFLITTNEGSQGIAQWRLNRLTNLVKFAELNGLNVEYLTTQLKFLDLELKKDYIHLYSGLTQKGPTVEELTSAFMTQYERPATATASLANRQKRAKAIYDYVQTLPEGE